MASFIDSMLGNIFRKQIEAAAEQATERALKAASRKVEYPDWALSQAASDQYSATQNYHSAAQIELYEKLDYLATVIDIPAQIAASNAQINVKRMVGEDVTDIPNHPFEKLLRAPNPLQGQMEFWRDQFSWYLLQGNTFIFNNASDDKTPPDELWVIPSNKIKPIPDGNLFIRGYVYNTGQEEIPLEEWQVIHIKNFNPTNQYIGRSLVQSLMTVSAAELAQQRYNASLYGENNAKVPGALVFADSFTPEAWDKLKNDVKRGWAGSRQSGPLFIQNVGAGGVQWLAMAMSQKDMQAIESSQFTKERIFANAPGLISILDKNATEANSKQGYETLINLHIYPTLQLFGQKYTQNIMPLYEVSAETNTLVAEFEDIRETNRIIELDELIEYSKTHTIGEVNKEYYGEKPKGDPRENLFVAELGASQPALTPGATTPAAQGVTPPVITSTQPAQPTPKAVDLDKWERKSLKAFASGKSAAVKFDSDHFGAIEKDSIIAKLLNAKSETEIKAAFVIDATPDPIIILANELREATKALRETAQAEKVS